MKGITADELMQFVASCIVTTSRTERPILQQGQSLDHAYLVIRGEVEISIIDTEGNSVLAHLAQPGEVVGEVELLSGRLCLANCRARMGTTLARFGLPLLRRFVPDERLLHNLACTFHDRLSRDDRQHLTAMFYSSEDRVRSHLLSLTSAGRARTQISQKDLAAFSGCSRQTVNRTLAQLRKDGIIEIGRGWVLVRDRQRLENLTIGARQRDLSDTEAPAAERG